jgi:hypothetical protein
MVSQRMIVEPQRKGGDVPPTYMIRNGAGYSAT